MSSVDILRLVMDWLAKLTDGRVSSGPYYGYLDAWGRAVLKLTIC